MQRNKYKQNMGNTTEKQEQAKPSIHFRERETPHQSIGMRIHPNRIKNDKKFQLKSALCLTQTDKLTLDLELKYAEQQMIPILKNLFSDNFKKTRLSEYAPILKRVKELNIMHNSCCAATINWYQRIKKAYKCYDCQIHKDSVLCYQCFFDGNHRGHRYVDVQVDGICDCGNPEILKEQGFCSRHNVNRQAQEELTVQNKSIKYIYFVKINIKWIFIIYQCNYTIYAEILLNELIHYLLEINQCNHSFLEESEKVFFEERDNEGLCLADHFIDLYCKYEKSRRQTPIGQAKLFQFFTRFFNNRQLGGLLFLAYCKAYSINQYFCKTQLINHLKHLASLKEVCEIALIKSDKAQPFLHYKNCNNYFIYYEQLYEILKAMPSEMAAQFVKPFLKAHIPFPYMQKSYESKFAKICQTQHLYLNLLIKIISLISDKRQLFTLLKKYIRMSDECKDCQSELQIPHKIIALILLRYSENSLSNLNNAAPFFKKYYKDFFFKMLLRSIQNLGKFCNTLSYKNRMNYTWNYASYYKINHAIYYDMLAIQAAVRILPEKAMEIEKYILKIIQNPEQAAYIKKFQSDKDCLARYMISIRHLKINLLNMFAEIAYSRIPQLYFGARLKQYEAIRELSEETLQSMFNTLEEVSESTFNSVKSFVFGGYLPAEIVENVAKFNKKTRMYRVKQKKGEKFNFNIIISLAQTQLYSLYTNYVSHQKMQSQLILTNALGCFNQQNRKIFEPIFSNKIVEYSFEKITNILNDQTSFIKKNDQFKMAIKLNKTLSDLYYNKDLLDHNFNLIKQAMLELGTLTKQIDTHRYYLENYHMIKEAQKVIQMKEDNKKEDLQKLKERQRQKRQALMRAKKIKENQQLLTAKEEVAQARTEDQNICVMCKQKGQLCYLTKISYTSLLFHFFTMNGENFTLDTCQHTIHYNCFIECHQQNNISRCPLCRQPFNAVIPLDNEDNEQLDRCWNYYEYLLESIRFARVNLLEECLLYLYYQQRMKNYFELQDNSQDLLKNTFILALIKHMQAKIGYTENLEEYIESNTTFRQQFERFKQKILGMQPEAREKEQLKQALPNIGQAQQSVDQKAMPEDQNSLNSNQGRQIQAERAILIYPPKCEGRLVSFPASIEGYLLFRDDFILAKQRSPSCMLCLVCNMHKAEVDKECLPSLFLNIKNATVQYRPDMKTKTIFDIYQDKDGEYWSITKKIEGFALNKNRLETIFRAFVSNNKEVLSKIK